MDKDYLLDQLAFYSGRYFKQEIDQQTETYSFMFHGICRSIVFKKGTEIVRGYYSSHPAFSRYLGVRLSEIPEPLARRFMIDWGNCTQIAFKSRKKPELRSFICSVNVPSGFKQLGEKPTDFNGSIGLVDIVEVKDIDLHRLGIEFIKRELCERDYYVTEDPREILDIVDGEFLNRDLDIDLYEYLKELGNIYVIGVTGNYSPVKELIN